jgi:hypothetical protein
MAGMAEILKNVGIGWLSLVIVGAVGALAVGVSLHGQVRIRPMLLPLGVILTPGAVLLVAGLCIDRRAKTRRVRLPEGGA